MKIAKAFFVMLYIQLVLQYGIIPVVIFGTDENTCEFKPWAAVFGVLLLISFAAVQVVGWISAVTAVKMHFNSEHEALKKSWKLLKLKTIPFYIFNFIYGILYIIMIIGASRGLAVIAVIPVLVPIWYTCAFIVQSGFFGAANVMAMRRKYGDNISVIHYVLQFLPVLDVIGTLILRNKCKKLETAATIE